MSKGSKDYEFHMPDGSFLTKAVDVDIYYGLGKNTTYNRLRIGWSEKECANNERNKGEGYRRYKFNMPDGSILTRPTDVDRYYNLGRNVTHRRLSFGWTEQECANNERTLVLVGKFKFYMPDGSILTRAADVDRYYGLKNGATSQRLKRGWAIEECAKNRKDETTHYFHMPDGSILTNNVDVDRYYNLSEGITSTRLNHGWTESECSNNYRKGYRGYKKQKKREFHMPDGRTLTKCSEVDNYYKLGRNITNTRLKRGWTEEECAKNKRNQENRKFKSYEFHMLDGSILHSCVEVDRYYNLSEGVTSTRLNHGWTEQECANNKRNIEPKYRFEMPDGSILTRLADVDRYYKLKIGTTKSRVRRWTEQECANNKRNK